MRARHLWVSGHGWNHHCSSCDEIPRTRAGRLRRPHRRPFSPWARGQARRYDDFAERGFRRQAEDVRFVTGDGFLIDVAVAQRVVPCIGIQNIWYKEMTAARSLKRRDCNRQVVACSKPRAVRMLEINAWIEHGEELVLDTPQMIKPDRVRDVIARGELPAGIVK